MKPIDSVKNNPSSDSAAHKSGSRVKKIFRIIIFSILGVLLLATVLITGVTLWLTPERLTEIVNREADKNLYADVEAYNIRFTFWSTFPHLRIEIDSINVVSKTLDSIPADLLRQLPPDSKRLLSTGKFSGGINILSLLKGKISLSEVEIEDLALNLVAATDSTNNYSVIPEGSGPEKIPYFTARSILLKNPREIRWYSLPSQASVMIKPGNMGLLRDSHILNRYHLSIDGNINAAVSQLEILRGFPFELDGDLDLHFNPFGITTSNYSVELGELHGNMGLNVEMGSSTRINSFEYHLDSFNLKALLARIPGITLPSLNSLNANLEVNASARLTSPYNFSSTALPSAEVDFHVEDGEISYTLTDGSTYRVRHEGAEGILNFNGKNPEESSFVIPPFKLLAPGTELDVSGLITGLLSTPEVEASVKGESKLNKLDRILGDFGINGLKGKLNVEADTKFHISGLKAGNIEDFTLNGNLSLMNYAGKRKKTGIEGDKLNISFTGSSNNVETAGITNGKIHITGNMSVADDKKKYNLNGLDILLTAARREKPLTITDYNVPDKWLTDSRSLGFLQHTPAFLNPVITGKIRDDVQDWNIKSSLKLNGGEFMMPGIEIPLTVTGLNLAATTDSVRLNSLAVRLGASELKMKGLASNLRQFMFSRTPAPLNLKFDVALDTMQLNQIARSYEKVLERNGYPYSKEKAAAPAPDDTITILLPRNINAELKLSAKHTRYTNLHLYDLTSGINLKDGNLEIKDMRIDADFGYAYLDFGYNTQDAQHLGMNCSLGIMDINIVRFFENFHGLLEMMPEMGNLSGTVAAEAKFNLLSFPNMYVNIPSLRGNITAQGRDLRVKQSPFIRKIMRMIMIHEDDTLNIANMNVHASLHDNLLEVYPFKFQLDKYILYMQGVNNFDGDLYYHIKVDKSPVPFPFGVNIQGNFSHPQLRFGGARYKVDRGAQITSSVMELHKVNIIAEGRKYMGEFIHKAAVSDGK